MKNKKIIKDIVLFILIAIYFSSSILLRKVGNLDELWNYNFASNISNGLIPYKDFNMITTPLLSVVGGIFLSIFGKELIVIRFLNAILSTSIIFMMYKIMGELKVKDYISLTLLAILIYIFKEYEMFDYNYAISLLSLIIVYLELKHYKNDRKSYQIFIGILAGICITLKQTTGLLIAITLVGYKILDVRTKLELKEFLKLLLWRITGILIPILIMIIYLIINNAFYAFIDYCVLGVATFSNKVLYLEYLIMNSSFLIRIFSVMPLLLLVLLVLYIKNRDINALILSTFGIATLSVVYPISDEVHLISGIFITIISLAYILNKLIKKEVLVFDIFMYVFMILFIMYQLINAIYIYAKSNKNTEIEHYKGLTMEQKQINNISKICEYIENSDKKVYILDFSAAYYMIPLNRYNKDYDMFNVGNLGSKGEPGQIENIEKEKGNIKVFIKNNNYSRNWQNPEMVRKWIIKNMNKTGEIGTFDIYE